jgi:hypothetical protein
MLGVAAGIPFLFNARKDAVNEAALEWRSRCGCPGNCRAGVGANCHTDDTFISDGATIRIHGSARGGDAVASDAEP